jgi:hypothetical protein
VCFMKTWKAMTAISPNISKQPSVRKAAFQQIQVSKFLALFWMFTHLSTLIYCLLQSSNKFSFFWKGVWLTNLNDIPLNQTQLFSSREIQYF